MIGLNKIIVVGEITVMNANKRNLIHVEFLRIIAIWLVMFNHTVSKGFYLFIKRKTTGLYWIYLSFSIIDRIAVPLFFMFSGALLLGKKESLKDVCIKRIFKFVIVLFASSFGYYLYDWKYNGHQFDLSKFVKLLYCNKVSTQLWYLYSFIGVMIMLPMLRRLVDSLHNSEYIYWLICHFILTYVIPISEWMLTNGEYSLSEWFKSALVVENNIFYFVMGYYIERVVDIERVNKKEITIGIISAIACIVILCFAITHIIDIKGVKGNEYKELLGIEFVAIPTLVVYICAKKFFITKSMSERVKRILQVMGSLTFSVFLLERVLREQTEFVYKKSAPIIGSFVASALWITVAWIIGFIVAFIIRKLKLVVWRLVSINRQEENNN